MKASAGQLALAVSRGATAITRVSEKVPALPVTTAPVAERCTREPRAVLAQGPAGGGVAEADEGLPLPQPVVPQEERVGRGLGARHPAGGVEQAVEARDAAAHAGQAHRAARARRLEDPPVPRDERKPDALVVGLGERAGEQPPGRRCPARARRCSRCRGRTRRASPRPRGGRRGGAWGRRARGVKSTPHERQGAGEWDTERPPGVSGWRRSSPAPRGRTRSPTLRGAGCTWARCRRRRSAS